jgi:hypothetical protein
MSNKPVSEMSDDEIRALAGATDPVVSYLTEARDRARKELPFVSPAEDAEGIIYACHDSVRLVAALEAVLARVGLWEKYAATFPHIDREAAAEQIRLAISAALLGKEATDA